MVEQDVYIVQDGSISDGAGAEFCRELEERNALGDITSQLFPNYGDFFGIPKNSDLRCFEILSVFVKEGRTKFIHAGSLCKNGGLLVDESVDLLRLLRPHLHSSSKQEVDRYLIGSKLPFTRHITEFFVNKLSGRPEGKFFSWLEMGSTQVEYVDPVKLTAALKNVKINANQAQLQGKKYVYVMHKASV